MFSLWTDKSCVDGSRGSRCGLCSQVLAPESTEIDKTPKEEDESGECLKSTEKVQIQADGKHRNTGFVIKGDLK